jgi:hypothetical protein
MKDHHLLATFAFVLGAGACVEPADPVTTEPAEALGQFCQPTYSAQAPVPPPKLWNNTLPADVGTDQVWLILPLDAQLSKYAFYQVDKFNKKVAWRTELTEAQRPYATYLAALRPGTNASVRNPPPPPWPPADDWVHADAVVNEAYHIVGSHF